MSTRICLLPTARRASLALARRRWRWIVVCGGYAGTVAAAGAATALLLHDDAAHLTTRAEAVSHQNEARRLNINELTVALAFRKQHLDAASSVRHHPDWSELLAMVAGLCRDRAVMTSCVLSKPDTPPPSPTSVPTANSAAPAPQSTPPQDPEPTIVYWLTVEGVAKSQTDVSSLVLSLEQVGEGLFGRISLLRSQAAQVRETPAVTFEIRCEIVEFQP